MKNLAVILWFLLVFLMGCGGGSGPGVDPPPAGVKIIGAWTVWSEATPSDTFTWNFKQDGPVLNLYQLPAFDDADGLIGAVDVSGTSFTVTGEAADGAVILKFSVSGSFSAGAISGVLTTTELLNGEVQSTDTTKFAGVRKSPGV